MINSGDSEEGIEKPQIKPVVKNKEYEKPEENMFD